jgi:hypothetical protein
MAVLDEYMRNPAHVPPVLASIIERMKREKLGEDSQIGTPPPG